MFTLLFFFALNQLIYSSEGSKWNLLLPRDNRSRALAHCDLLNFIRVYGGYLTVNSVIMYVSYECLLQLPNHQTVLLFREGGGERNS